MATVGAPQKENRAPALSNGPLLSCGELKMMLGQCLKMASENKITASNTWGLPLIEHLDDLIKEDDPTRHPNFQRASVTLDAGVKIYSYRVDSVHTETFKILGGLGRASGPTDDAEGELGDGGVGENASPSKRKRRNQDLNPEATLEPTLEALNIKKFDLAFAVDPLFHKTSAQFDEGGAIRRGLPRRQSALMFFEQGTIDKATLKRRRLFVVSRRVLLLYPQTCPLLSMVCLLLVPVVMLPPWTWMMMMAWHFLLLSLMDTAMMIMMTTVVVVGMMIMVVTTMMGMRMLMVSPVIIIIILIIMGLEEVEKHLQVLRKMPLHGSLPQMKRHLVVHM